jgi:hypothetical protein
MQPKLIRCEHFPPETACKIQLASLVAFLYLQASEPGSHAAPEPGGRGQAPARLRRQRKQAAFLEKLHSVNPIKYSHKTTATKKRKAKHPSATLTNFAAALAEGLPSIPSTAGIAYGEAGVSVTRLKAKERIAREESSRAQHVYQHPAFRADPLSAIKSHLTAMLPPPPQPPKAQPTAQQRKLEKKRRKAQQAAAASLGSKHGSEAMAE